MDEDNPFAKAQTVDPEVRAYVYSLVNALGGSSSDENGRYVLGDDALACLRDIKRWLKLYDEKTNRLDVARCLAEAKLVTGDLLPILASWPEDQSNDRLKARVALACLEVLVPLTWPLETMGEMTMNHHRHTPYLQQTQVLYKAGVLGWDTCRILHQIIRIGLPSIAMPREQRTNRDDGIIRLMLYFIRNVAAIRQVPNLPSQGLEAEVSRSATIEAFRDQDVFALLLTICSNMGDDFNLQDVIVLEILFNLIKGVDIRKLWMTEDQRQGKELFDLKSTLSAEMTLEREAKRNEQSRHGRFGTMIWLKREDEKVSAISGQDNLKDERNALFNMDKSKKWSKPQQKRKDMEHTMYDFDRSVPLTVSAGEKLRNFVEEFLDSGFNPLFTHLRKAIEREAERVLDVNYRQFFYTVAWFLQAERVRREKLKKEVRPTNVTSEFDTESFSLVASVLNQETFITLNRYMQASYDNKEWQDLQASMRCFTQILLTVQEMAQSPLEEDQEIADNIQNRIFYEETTHDRIVSILKGYKDQGFGYLDACTELSHVFLRMLERYSKENVDLQIRSRRRARKQKKIARQHTDGQEQGEENEDENSENEDIAEIIQVSKERKFDFTRFAAKFTSQASVNTFVAFTAFYRDLSVEQLKRAHRFFYRVAFKHELAVLLYRVDIVALFYKMIKGPEGIDVTNSTFKEWTEFSRQLFKKMFKKMDQRPELLVELLFSKINATLYYLEHGREKQTIAMTRAPAELEVRPAPGRDLNAQIGIVVTVLHNDDKSFMVHWIKQILGSAFDERHGWEAEREARRIDVAGEADEVEKALENHMDERPTFITVVSTSEDIQTAMFKDARLKLLMRLVGFEILGGEDKLGATWIVPPNLTAEQLREAKSIIEQYEVTPWQAESSDQDPESLLRRSRNTATTVDDEEDARRDAFIDDSEGNDDIEEFMFPDNIRKKSDKSKTIIEKIKASRKKRKRDSDGDESDTIDDELAAKRRKAREEAALERRRKIKSELYITNSDDEDDEEADKEFFRKEEELRKRQEANIQRQLALGIAEDSGTKKNQKKNKKASRMPFSDSETDDELVADRGKDVEISSDLGMDSDDAIANEETPLSSQSSDQTRLDTVKRAALKELQQQTIGVSKDLEVSKMATSGLLDGEQEDKEDEEDDVVSAAPRRQRAGFVIDSDDDE